METRIVLIYDTNKAYNSDVQVMEFETDTEALEYINANSIHEDDIFGMFEIIRRVHIEPVEIVKRYKLKYP